MDDFLRGVRAVLFDMDGTLVDTNIDFALMKQQMVSLAESHGISAARVQGLDILGVVEFVVANVAGRCGRSEALRIRQQAFRKLEEIEMLNVENSREVPGARTLLSALTEAGIKTGIVTRNCRRAVEISLGRAGIAADVLLTRDDVHRTKPHPDHLLRALEMLGTDPCCAVMVGDHWMDVRGGRAAGTRTVGFLRQDRPEGFFDCDPPDLIVRSLAELLECFQRLRR